MKMRFIKLLIASVLFGIPAASSAKEISVLVKGMVCGFCAQGIEKKLKALPDVSGVSVSLASKLVKISTKENADISDQKLKELMEDAGYNIEKIERK